MFTPISHPAHKMFVDGEAWALPDILYRTLEELQECNLQGDGTWWYDCGTNMDPPWVDRQQLFYCEADNEDDEDYAADEDTVEDSA